MTCHLRNRDLSDRSRCVSTPARASPRPHVPAPKPRPRVRKSRPKQTWPPPSPPTPRSARACLCAHRTGAPRARRSPRPRASPARRARSPPARSRRWPAPTSRRKCSTCVSLRLSSSRRPTRRVDRLSALPTLVVIQDEWFFARARYADPTLAETRLLLTRTPHNRFFFSIRSRTSPCWWTSGRRGAARAS